MTWKPGAGLIGLCLVLSVGSVLQDPAETAAAEACDGGDSEDCAAQGDALLQQASRTELTHLTSVSLSEDVDAASLATANASALQALMGDPEDWVKRHNYWRCIHGSPPIAWDKDFAIGAQKWADNDEFKHDDCYNLPAPYGPAGENIAGGSKGYMSINKACDMWHDEEPEKGPKCGGHCTAMLWKAASKLGCGINYKSSQGLFLVCRYGGGSPLPNMGGHYEANVGFPDMSKEPECKKKHMEGDGGGGSPSPPPPPPPSGSPSPPPPPGGAPAPSPDKKAMQEQLDQLQAKIEAAEKQIEEAAGKL